MADVNASDDSGQASEDDDTEREHSYDANSVVLINVTLIAPTFL